MCITGQIGLEAFRTLMNDQRLKHIPLIQETPYGSTVHKKETALL